jgi:hypothetical protein
VRCYGCDYYESTYMWNGCTLTGSECFRPQDKCTLVNDDGSVNFGDPYFTGQIKTDEIAPESNPFDDDTIF